MQQQDFGEGWCSTVLWLGLSLLVSLCSVQFSELHFTSTSQFFVFCFFLFSLSQVVQDSWRELELYISRSPRERLEQARVGYFPLTGSDLIKPQFSLSNSFSRLIKNSALAYFRIVPFPLPLSKAQWGFSSILTVRTCQGP